MELIVLPENKSKAKKRRIRNERKWIPLRVFEILSLILAVTAFIVGVFFIPSEKYKAVGICGAVFAVFLICFVVAKALLWNFTSHWVTERLNERIWIENHALNHFIQRAFAAGINVRSADERGYLFVMDISSIYDAKADPKSGRLEFKVNGKGYRYADVFKDIIDKSWDLKGFPAVFYDYTEPGILQTLEEYGVFFERKTLDFKLFDNQI